MDSYPAVLEAQQDQQQALDTVLVKLQLELQQQLAPRQQQLAGGDDTAATPDTRLVAARLIAVEQEQPQPSGCSAPSADEAAAGLDSADAAVAADIVAAAIAAAIASSSSVAIAAAPTTPAAAMEGVEGSPSRAASERCLSCNEEDASWHLVSRGGSVRAPSSTGRCSFEDAGAGSVSPFAPPSTTTDLSEYGSEHGGTPRDELAASILGHPVMLAAQQVEAAAAAALDAPPDSGLDSIRSSITLHPSATSSCVLEPPAAPSSAAAPAGEGDSLAEPGAGAEHVLQDASGAVPVVGAGEALSLLSGGLLQLAGAAHARASEGLEGLRDWIVESLAALVQSGRMSQAACLSRAHATLAQLTLAAKQQGGLAAAAAHAASDWRLLLSSAAAVVCLAMWMKSRKEATVLRSMLRRRDHELSKLVMRVVSLQELINAGGHLQPISRFGGRSFESVTTVSASFM